MVKLLGEFKNGMGAFLINGDIQQAAVFICADLKSDVRKYTVQGILNSSTTVNRGFSPYQLLRLGHVLPLGEHPSYELQDLKATAGSVAVSKADLENSPNAIFMKLAESFETLAPFSLMCMIERYGYE